MKDYQEIFNKAMSKMRVATMATGNDTLMKTLAKIMFDFSDDLKDNKLITNKEENNEKTESAFNK